VRVAQSGIRLKSSPPAYASRYAMLACQVGAQRGRNTNGSDISISQGRDEHTASGDDGRPRQTLHPSFMAVCASVHPCAKLTPIQAFWVFAASRTTTRRWRTTRSRRLTLSLSTCIVRGTVPRQAASIPLLIGAEFLQGADFETCVENIDIAAGDGSLVGQEPRLRHRRHVPQPVNIAFFLPYFRCFRRSWSSAPRYAESSPR